MGINNYFVYIHYMYIEQRFGVCAGVPMTTWWLHRLRIRQQRYGRQLGGHGKGEQYNVRVLKLIVSAM
jgi:hypothetical protein